MTAQSNQNNQGFTIGQMVSLKTDPSIFGAIIQIIKGEHEIRYEVFHGQSKSTYYESQLIPYQPAEETITSIPLDLFNARLTALQINQPWISSLYSLHAARVNFIPFQFKPVLKLINSDRPNLLIADEVGVGKTIEAGLILRELQSRRDIQSVLVLCPKPLVTDRKWQLELKRFDEEFTHLDGPTLRYCINETDLDGKWPLQHSKAIIPFSLFDEMLLFGGKIGRRRQKGLLEIIPPIQFDLVIIDEAHHLRNTETYVHRVARYFCENAESIIMLTATPIQLGDNDLYVLLNLLRPDLVIDRNSFEQMSEPNPYINKAVDFARAAQQSWEEKVRDVLKKASATEWGKVMLEQNPEFQKVLSQLETAMTPEHRLEFIRTTEQFHTFSGLINRTRRRDIGTFTTRKPETVSIEFTPAQRNIHDALLELQAEMLSLIHDPKNIKFMMTILRRQAASCIHGLAPLLKMILGRTLSKVIEGDDLEDEWDNSVNAFRADIKDLKREKLDELKQKIESLINRADNLPKDDHKSNALIKIIEEKQKMPNNKILLFSTFRHTLSYLHQKLINTNIRLGMVHGDIKDIDRQDLRQRFSLSREENDAIDVLLSSEVGCEGLDYQFCDCLINYDIPWNPMRVEQRIGRIDRFGQKSESILIYNFITPDTVDADIYERCLMRIGVFRRSLGGSEEILGKISQQIMNIAENYKLTNEERKAQLQQIADNEIRLQIEQVELEERQAELFGINLPLEKTRKDVEDATSYWLSPEALHNLIEKYLRNNIGVEQPILGEKPLKTLRLNQDARNKLLSDFQNAPKQSSPLYREWGKWLKASEANLSITFNSDYAMENRKIVFITPIHPLVRQAATALNEKIPSYCIFKASNISLPGGKYPFVIYQWKKIGIKTETSLQIICNSESVSRSFLKIMRSAVDAMDEYALPEKNIFEALDKQHYLLWTEAKKAHQRDTAQMVAFRMESLKTSHMARQNQLQDLLKKANNENIRRMRESQIATAEGDYKRRAKEIQEANLKAEIIAEPIAFGLIVIV